MTNKTRFIKRLHLLVREGDEVDRSYAIRALSDLKDSGSTELLFEHLHDEDLDVSIDAVNALGKIGGRGSVDKLIESFIKDPEGEIKVACLESLVMLGDKKAIPHFLSIAEQRPDEMAFETGDWDLWWDMQLQAIKGLGKLKVAEAIPVLRRLIEADEYLDIENEIFNTVVEIGGEESDELLLSLLSDGKARVKRRVVKALGNSQSKSTLKLLARSLQDKDPNVRVATLLALQQRNVIQYLPAVLLLFRDGNADVRKVAVKVAHNLSLQVNKDEDTSELIEKLKPLMRDNDPVVKTTVLNALLSLGWKADIEESEFLSEQLKTCIGDCFAMVCRVIVEQHLADGYAVLLFLLRQNELETEEKIHALSALGQSRQWNTAMESTIGSLVFDEKSVVRLSALEALADLDKDHPEGSAYEGRLPIEMISEALEGRLSPPEGRKIIPIVPIDDIEKKFEQEAQLSSSKEKTVEKNQDEAQKPDTTFVDNALEQIHQSIAGGEKPHPMSTLDAIAITHVEDEIEKAAGKPSSFQAGDQVEDDLEDFIALTENNKEISKWLFNKSSVDVSVDIKRLAARILGKVGSSNALPYLLNVFDSKDSELKRESALSIAELIGTGKVQLESKQQIAEIHEILSKELNAEERDLRIAIARALAELGSVDDIPNLIEKLYDEDVSMRMQALKSLSKIACRIDDQSVEDKSVNYVALAELMLEQLKSNMHGVHRAVVDALIPLFGNKLNGSSVSLKQTAISYLIQAGLSGSHGQVQEMSQGLIALDKELSSMRLLEKIDEVSNSVERRYMVEMLGQLHRAES